MESTEMMKRKFIVYASAVIFLALIALVANILTSYSSQLQRCQSNSVAADRYSCLSTLALQTRNTSICGTLPGSNASNCYLNIAESSLNAHICNSVNNSAKRSSCIAYVATNTGSYAECSGIQEPYLSDCAFAAATKSDNASLCGSLSSPINSSECYSIAYTRTALAKNISSYCAYVSTVNTSQNSIEVNYVMQNAGNGPDSSNALTLLYFSAPGLRASYSARDYCYLNLALSKENSSLCSDISNVNFQNLCSQRVSSLSAGRNVTGLTNQTLNYTQMLQACSGVSQYQTLCTNSVLLLEATKTLNASICAQLSQNVSNTCYSDIADTEKNVSLCSRISNSTAQQICAFGAAKQLNSSSGSSS